MIVNIFRVLSLILQLFLLLSFYNVSVGIIEAIEMFSSGDPKLVAGSLSAGVVLSLLQIIPALIGLSLSFWFIKKSDKIPSWYLKLCKIFSYLWLIFIPIGTVLGLRQLKLINNA